MRGLLTGWLPWKARNRLIFCPELVSVRRCRGWVWGWLQEQAEMAWEARLCVRRPPSLPPLSVLWGREFWSSLGHTGSGRLRVEVRHDGRAE